MHTAHLPHTTAGRRQWWGLAVLALPVLLLSTDLSVLYLALPALSTDLAPSGTAQLWIVDIYGFMVAGFLVMMGSLGDRIGHRRVLLFGALCFAGASILAAYAASTPMLIFARALLGLAGATLAPTTLALITRMFADPAQRAVAVAVWSGCFMGGAILGPVLGGLLLASFWWGSVFLLAVPVMVLLLVTAPALLPQQRASHHRRLDPASVVLLLATVLSIVYGVKELARGGAQPLPVAAAVAGAGFGVLFVYRHRRSADPLLDLGLFRTRAYRCTVLTSTGVGALQGGLLLVVNQHLQLVARLSPLAAGLWLVPPALAMLIGVTAGTGLARRFRPGTVIAAGLLCSAVGNLALARVADAPAVWWTVAALCLVMAGVGPMASLGYNLILDAAPADRAGSASAAMETGGQLGIALGIGLLGSLAAGVYRDRLVIPPGVPDAEASAAREGLAGAVAAADHLPGLLGADLLATATHSYADGLGVVAAVSAVCFLALAGYAARSLRDA